VIDDTKLNHWFSNNALRDDQKAQINRLRDGGKELAKLVLSITPQTADQTRAITKIREAIETATTAVTNNT